MDIKAQASLSENTDLLRNYYSQLFPLDSFAKWLSYCNDEEIIGADRSFFARREFACGFDTNLSRYLSFGDGKALKEYLVTKCPDRIDIGPVYNVNPTQRKLHTGGSDEFQCAERELVFDIDMDEYDSVRTCCSEGRICQKDWAYMAAAIQVIDTAMKEDFGFEHILWVYSGRRGVHGWVCDKRARELTDEQRKSVAEFLTVYKGQVKDEPSLSIINTAYLSHSRAYKICREFWINRILPEQQLLEDDKHYETIMKILDNGPLKKAVETAPLSLDSDRNQQMWEVIEEEIEELNQRQGTRNSHEELHAALVILTYVYPRIDKDVSCKRNHLLKAPFCAHPKTGRICVPIDIQWLWEFNPEQVPTISGLNEQLEHHYQLHGDLENVETALEPYLRFFKSFIDGMRTDNISNLNKSLQHRSAS